MFILTLTLTPGPSHTFSYALGMMVPTGRPPTGRPQQSQLPQAPQLTPQSTVQTAFDCPHCNGGIWVCVSGNGAVTTQAITLSDPVAQVSLSSGGIPNTTRVPDTRIPTTPTDDPPPTKSKPRQGHVALPVPPYPAGPDKGAGGSKGAAPQPGGGKGAAAPPPPWSRGAADRSRSPVRAPPARAAPRARSPRPASGLQPQAWATIFKAITDKETHQDLR